MNQAPMVSAGDSAWLLTASALVLLMTPGLAFFYGGMVRKKNLLSTMFQSYISMAVVSLIWIVIGFSLAFGDSIGGFIGNPMSFVGFKNVGAAINPAFAATIPFALFALFQMKFAIITPALVTGAFAERLRFKAYLIFMAFFSLFIYSPVAHWAWHPDGFLHKLGLLDFAGGTVVHITAGMAALAAVTIIKPRFESEHLPSNVPFVLLGTGMLWFGWFGFNAGSALAANGQAVMAFITTNTASAAGMLTWMLLDWKTKGKPSPLGACIGAVVALVAITPGAGYVSVMSSIIIGATSNVASYLAVQWRSKTSLDDTLDVFPCHGVGGIFGMIATAIFAQEGGVITGQWRLLGVHIAALLIVAGYAFLMSYAGFWLIKKFMPLEVEAERQAVGLDIHEHGETIGDTLGHVLVIPRGTEAFAE